MCRPGAWIAALGSGQRSQGPRPKSLPRVSGQVAPGTRLAIGLRPGRGEFEQLADPRSEVRVAEPLKQPGQVPRLPVSPLVFLAQVDRDGMPVSGAGAGSDM